MKEFVSSKMGEEEPVEKDREKSYTAQGMCLENGFHGRRLDVAVEGRSAEVQAGEPNLAAIARQDEESLNERFGCINR